jgi:hypothetical protein
MIGVANEFIQEANTGVARLQTDVAAAGKTLKMEAAGTK